MRTFTGKLPLLAGSIGCALIACAASALAEDVVLSLELAPKPDAKFVFGKRDEMRFILENKSKNALVVRSITPRTTHYDAVILSGTIYGSIQKHEIRDEWTYNGLSQQATMQSLHAGLLLPGERLTALSPYRPVARCVEFEVAYLQSEKPYDGTPESLKPFRIYVPGSRDRLDGIRQFVPFSETRWKAVSTQFAATNPLGPASSPRMVFIPNESFQQLLTAAPERKPRLKEQPKSITFHLAVPLQETDFCLEEALPVAARLAGRPAADLRAAYSSSLGQYVIFERDCSWRLASKDQQAKGELLGPFPPSLLNALDAGQPVSVRVGEKQENGRTRVREAGYLFWDRFPVRYGDGMYTRGEFIHLGKDELLAFLKLAHGKNKVLDAHSYFFRSEYFFLRDRPEEPAKP